MNNREIIEKFYTAFAQADAEGMISCYAADIEFEDPAFGKLKGAQAANMWRMLVNPGNELKVTFSDVWTEGNTGGAHWEAQYTFSKTGRKVWNRIDAVFEFREGRIIRHKDHFSFWKWTQQSLGMPGYLLGWSSFLHKKVQKQALERLSQFEQRRKGA